MAAAALDGVSGGADDPKAPPQPTALAYAPPLPPPHDLSECPTFDAKTVTRATEVLARVISEAYARRIARVVAADATAAERADAHVLAPALAKAWDGGVGPWPWTDAAGSATRDSALNAHAPALGLWYRTLVCDAGGRGSQPDGVAVGGGASLRWSDAADRDVLLCITWACLRQGLRLNYRSKRDADTPLTAALYDHTAFAYALLALPDTVGLDVGVPDSLRLYPFLIAVVGTRHADAALESCIGARCSAWQLSQAVHVLERGDADAAGRRRCVAIVESPLWHAAYRMARGMPDGVRVFRAVVALAHVDGSGGVCVADMPWPDPADPQQHRQPQQQHGCTNAVTVYATPRAAYAAMLSADTTGRYYCTPEEEAAAAIDAALTEADAVCAAVKAYPNALLQCVCTALEPSSPFAALHGVLQIVLSYVVTPPPPPSSLVWHLHPAPPPQSRSEDS